MRERRRERERERERITLYYTKIKREREIEDTTLLQKDKDLSTSRLFYKSVPDVKHSNAQYIKQKYKQLRQIKYKKKKREC